MSDEKFYIQSMMREGLKSAMSDKSETERAQDLQIAELIAKWNWLQATVTILLERYAKSKQAQPSKNDSSEDKP